MLIENVFAACADDLIENAGRPIDLTQIQHVFGCFIPKREQVEQASFEESAIHLQEVLRRCRERAVEIGIVVGQPAWYPSTRVNAHLGIKKGFSGDPGILRSMLAEDRIQRNNDSRYFAFSEINHDLIDAAVTYISIRQKLAFLTLGRSVLSQSRRILSAVLDHGSQGFKEDKMPSTFRWGQLWPHLEQLDVVVIRSIGWLEEFCDFRFLAFGTKENLEQHLTAYG